MSITDELRKWGYGFCGDTHDVVTAIADRIDAEHERLMEERADRYSELRAKMNNCYIELPKDAGGEPIHIGDKVTCARNVWEVTGLRLTGLAWGVCCTIFNDHGGSGTNVYPPCDLRHYHAPTVEDMLWKLLGDIRPDMEDEEALPIVAAYAKKLRLADERE